MNMKLGLPKPVKRDLRSLTSSERKMFNMCMTLLDWMQVCGWRRPELDERDNEEHVAGFMGIDFASIEARVLAEASLGKRNVCPLHVILGTAFVTADGVKYASVQIIKGARATVTVGFEDGEAVDVRMSPIWGRRTEQIVRICKNFLAAEEAKGPIYRQFKRGEPEYV